MEISGKVVGLNVITSGHQIRVQTNDKGKYDTFVVDISRDIGKLRIGSEVIITILEAGGD